MNADIGIIRAETLRRASQGRAHGAVGDGRMQLTFIALRTGGESDYQDFRVWPD